MIVEIGSKAAQQYEKAGQYIQLKLQDSKPGFFAIASAPGQGDAGTVELLVKNKGDTAELLCGSQAGGLLLDPLHSEQIRTRYT